MEWYCIWQRKICRRWWVWPISSSSNGTSWTTPEYHYSYGSWLSIAYGNGKFVASSTNGRLYTSDDTGQTWSYIVPDIDGLSPANNDKYLNIVYNGEMFIAVGYNYSWNDDESRNLYTDIVTTSTDGVNWSTAVPIKDELGNVLRLTTLSIIAVSA